MTGSLLVVTGPPGAGKSTVAAAIADALDRSALIEGDAFFDFVRAGAIDPWLPESNAQNEIVTQATALATARFAEHYDTVFDGIVGPWFLPTFMDAGGFDQLDYVVLLPTVDSCLERVRTRVGHDFDDPDAARKMHAEFVAADLDARHVIADSDADVAGLVELVLTARAAGRLRHPAP